MNEIDPYTELANLYDYFIDERYKKYIEMLLQRIHERHPNLKNAVLVDVGGGTGYLTFQFYNQVKN